MARGDFNGDRFDDFAIGVPGEDGARGTVNVLYSAGDFGPLTDAGNQRWDQDTDGVQDTAEAGDQFGAALAAGDFNGDGFGDLAIGVPGEDGAQGAVNILFGSRDGLTDTDNVRLDVGAFGRDAAPGDQFGFALAAGDFNGNGFDDLAIGSPGQDDRNLVDAGEIHVFEGSRGGLTPFTEIRLSQESLEGAPNPDDHFGAALAAGNFNGDLNPVFGPGVGIGIDDLAIGVPGEEGGRGAVNIVYGSLDGLVEEGNQVWDQDMGTVSGTAEAGDQFGSAIATGNFNGDASPLEATGVRIDDLAIGVPGEDNDAGAVNVLFGSSEGLTDAGNQRWDQDTGTIQDTAEADDRFGAALAAGNFNGDANPLSPLLVFDDLAIGAPGENSNAGSVHVLAGSLSGLTDTGNQRWDQDTDTVNGIAEAGDRFGASLAASNFNGDFIIATGVPLDDLAIGVPGEDRSAGAVNVLYSGGFFGLGDAENQRWDQDTLTLIGTAEADDRFGSALTGDALFI